MNRNDWANRYVSFAPVPVQRENFYEDAKWMYNMAELEDPCPVCEPGCDIPRRGNYMILLYELNSGYCMCRLNNSMEVEAGWEHGLTVATILEYYVCVNRKNFDEAPTEMVYGN